MVVIKIQSKNNLEQTLRIFNLVFIKRVIWFQTNIFLKKKF
jgi:hypothetical protein